MDFWVGDHELFPKHMSEWSIEKIIRLNRPFLLGNPLIHSLRQVFLLSILLEDLYALVHLTIIAN